MTTPEIRRPAGTTAIVHLVRHGEVENPHGILYGRIPGYHLSETGRLMAKTAADYLAGRDVTVLKSSPLERALETAEPFAAEFGLGVEADDRLIESWNHFEGMRFGVGDGALRQPRHWIHLRNPFRPSWGEPYREVAARVLAAVRDAAREAGGHEAVCVSHQLPIWVTRRLVEGHRLWHDPRRRECALGSVTTLTFSGDDVTGVQYAAPSGNGRRQVAGA
ncbi:MAG TPA: histidine phosphatase family protein [Streptosporangiaceae bacterium]|jgi:broad specificity phosphatase PhoE|nr:histidine phosphatase family protein [Streptosporangiaceae bacterium]